MLHRGKSCSNAGMKRLNPYPGARPKRWVASPRWRHRGQSNDTHSDISRFWRVLTSEYRIRGIGCLVLCVMNILAFLSHRLKSYAEFARYIFGRLTGKVFVDREKNYWGYIAESRKKNCSHKEIRKISPTRFYCTNCGARLRYIREELSIISEITTIILAALVILKLSQKSREPEK